MGTHPIFESDFDCLTEQVKCPSPCWLPDFLLSQNWLPASPSAPCLFRSKTATLTPPPNSSVRVPPPLASPDLEQESELCSALSLLATQRCGGVGNVVVTPHQPTLCNNACTSLD